MGFWTGNFSAKNNTISDESWLGIRGRALKAQSREKGGMFSKKSVSQRKMQGESLKKWMWN